MIRTVTWISESDLPCEPTANVILCTATFAIAAQFVDTYKGSCPSTYAHEFEYDDADLPENYIDNYGPLADDDIENAFCEDCLTKWIRQHVDKAYELIITRGEDESGDDLVIPSTSPLSFHGGNGIDIALIQPNQVWVGFDPSSDENNQIILGSDNNPYVGPSLYGIDGWYSILDHGWSYLSANSITVPTGAALRHAKGDKIKIIQAATTKYLYITSVADTVLSVQGGSDYTVSNDPITSAYFSRDLSPVGFPSSFNFSTTYTGFSGLPTQIRRFSITGRRVRIDVSTTGAGTSNSADYHMTSPITSEDAGPSFLSGGGQGEADSIYQNNIFAQINANSNLIQLARDGGSYAWPTTGSKYANFNIEYNF